MLQGNKEIGKVAKCKHGILGLITAYSKAANKNIYYGRNFEGGFWQSTNPEIVAKNINEYIEMIKTNGTSKK